MSQEVIIQALHCLGHTNWELWSQDKGEKIASKNVWMLKFELPTSETRSLVDKCLDLMWFLKTVYPSQAEIHYRLEDNTVHVLRVREKKAFNNWKKYDPTDRQKLDTLTEKIANHQKWPMFINVSELPKSSFKTKMFLRQQCYKLTRDSDNPGYYFEFEHTSCGEYTIRRRPIN